MLLLLGVVSTVSPVPIDTDGVTLSVFHKHSLTVNGSIRNTVTGCLEEVSLIFPL